MRLAIILSEVFPIVELEARSYGPHLLWIFLWNDDSCLPRLGHQLCTQLQLSTCSWACRAMFGRCLIWRCIVLACCIAWSQLSTCSWACRAMFGRCLIWGGIVLACCIAWSQLSTCSWACRAMFGRCLIWGGIVLACCIAWSQLFERTLKFGDGELGFNRPLTRTLWL